jgi:hypothetical protein
MYSGPLSQRITGGFPRQEIICLGSLSNRAAGNEKSASQLPLQLKFNFIGPLTMAILKQLLALG